MTHDLENSDDDIELNFDITVKAKITSSLERELKQIMKLGQKIKELSQAKQVIQDQCDFDSPECDQ